MADQKSGIQDAEDRTGRDVQQSQATGKDEGVFFADGTQAGGGPQPSDMAAPGGSSGGGGYGNAQNQANHQGQQQGQATDWSGQDRGDAFDEQQGGGRDSASVSDIESSDPAENAQLDQQAEELLQDQQQHQNRGQVGYDEDEQR